MSMSKMKEFFETYIMEILTIIIIFSSLYIVTIYIHDENKERIAIINNTKENVKKYEECEKIENYYYCWNSKNGDTNE